MNEGVVARHDGGRPIGPAELAEGLMLVRASTIKVVRLQLAMERRDRRTAMATVDDLVTLDNQIQEFLGVMPNAAKQRVMQRELEAQLGALAREKLTLAAGMSRRPAGDRAWIEPVRAAEPAQPMPANELNQTWLGLADDYREQPEPAPSRRIHRLAALLLLAMAAIAVSVSQMPDGLNLLQHASLGGSR